MRPMVRRASGAGTLRASLESSMSSGRLLVRNCKPRPVLQNSPGPRQAKGIRPESLLGGRSGGGLRYFVVEELYAHSGLAVPVAERFDVGDAPHEIPFREVVAKNLSRHRQMQFHQKPFGELQVCGKK